MALRFSHRGGIRRASWTIVQLLCVALAGCSATESDGGLDAAEASGNDAAHDAGRVYGDAARDADLSDAQASGVADASDTSPPLLDVLATAEADAQGRFAIFARAVRNAGLADELRQDLPLTVFAPTDAAFEALDPSVLERLQDGSARSAQTLREMLGFHLVPGALSVADLSALADIPELNRLPMSVRRDADGQLFYGEGRVISPDIEAANGFVHGIDALALPRCGSGQQGYALLGCTLAPAGCASDEECPSAQVCRESLCTPAPAGPTFQVIQIRDESSGDSCSAYSNNSMKGDPGADVLYAYVSDRQGTLRGWAELVDFREGTNTRGNGFNDARTVFDGQAPDYIGSSECPAAFRDGKHLSLGCGGYVLVKFVDAGGAPVDIAVNDRVVVGEWGTPSCGSADTNDSYSVHLCTDTARALSLDTESCNVALGFFTGGIQSSTVTLP